MIDVMINVTNGTLRVQQGDDNTALITALDTEKRVALIIFESELPWLINALEDVHRQLTADADRTQDAAALVQWDADTLASMMAG